MNVHSRRNILSAILLFVAVVEIILLANAIYHKVECALYSTKYYEEVNYASEKFDVPKEIIYAVIKAESNFNKDALSHAGAMGLMQMLPDTYLWLAGKAGELSARAEDLWSPKINIYYGTAYLKYLYERFGTWSVAVAAYNAGPTRVSSWLSDNKYSDDGKTLRYIPFAETSRYVRKFERLTKKYNQIYNFN